MEYKSQKPTETIAYRVAVENDTVSSCTWSIAPTGPSVVSVSRTSTEATCKVSGLTLATKYVLRATVSMASGQIRVSEIGIRCE